MKKIMLMASLVLSSALAFSGVSLSQQRNSGQRMYDPKTVETVKGEVVAVDRIAPGYAQSGGIHLRLKTAGENIAVHLGPAWFVEKQEVKVARNDRVEVTGSRVKYGKEFIIIASTLSKEGKTMVLRDEKGVPKWSGWRGRGRGRGMR